MKIIVDLKEKENNFEYSFIVPLSGDTQVVKTLSENEMISLFDDISTVLGYKPIIEKFNCSVEDAKDIKREIDRKSDCRDCDLKMIECYRCCKVCESPLEKDLLKALIRNGISVELQMRINKDNTISHFPEKVDPSKILTIPDFYIETQNKKICVYTDGHTYHERTEYQAVRDRTIDRDLQNLGYIVLRYTTSEIRNKLDNVIMDIKKSMGIEQEDYDSSPKSDEVIEDGSCIRCGARIPYSINNPYCENCYQIWAHFRNRDYVENYCHKCGKQINNITYAQPLCKNCSQ